MNNYEIRYVFDIGSGTTKSMSCLVDKESQKLVAILDKITVSMPYQKYISNSQDGKTLTTEAMSHGCTAMAQILDYYHIDAKDAYVKCAGIATAWARNADNVQEYLDYIKQELGIYVQAISQVGEGELGIKAVLASPLCPVPDPEKILVWDVGGGSFQLSYLDKLGDIVVYNGPFGSSNFTKMIHDLVGCETEELLNQEQMLQAVGIAREIIGQPISSNVNFAELQSHASEYVYAIGQLMNAGIKPMVQQNTIALEQIYDLMWDYTAYSKQELQTVYPELKPEFIAPQQTNLLLAYSIMEALNMDEVHFASNAQSLNAIAVEEDLWIEDNFAEIWYGPEPDLYYAFTA